MTCDDYKALIAAAATAWNLSLLPQHALAQALAESLRAANGKGGDRGLIVALMERKEELFPEDDRQVAHWEAWESENQFHLTVLSGM